MRFFIGFLVTIGLIVLIFVLILRGGGSGSTTTIKAVDLTAYATNASSEAEFLVDGPVNADSLHRQLKIEVSEDSVTLTTYQGYEQTVLNSQSYPNNQDAYATFLRSLQIAGFTHGDTAKSLADERGSCPSSRRYVMSFMADNKQLSRFWYSGCGGGTFKGAFNTVESLFTRQVPDYSKQTNNLNF